MYRYALVAFRSHVNTPAEDAKVIAAYLPGNYEVLDVTSQGVVIRGKDDHGWSMEKYVIPRLASGLYAAQEIDLSHPAMKEIDL